MNPTAPNCPSRTESQDCRDHQTTGKRHDFEQTVWGVTGDNTRAGVEQQAGLGRSLLASTNHRAGFLRSGFVNPLARQSVKPCSCVVTALNPLPQPGTLNAAPRGPGLPRNASLCYLV